MYITEAMVTDVKTCLAGANLDDIARQMWEHDVGSIPVVTDDNRPIGIITDRDIAMAAMLNHQPLWEIKAMQLIEGQHLCCCHAEETLESCLVKMQQNSIRRVPVVTGDGSLNGIISMGDAVAFSRNRSRAGDQNAIETEDVMGMLKNVSAHHPSPDKPAAPSNM